MISPFEVPRTKFTPPVLTHAIEVILKKGFDLLSLVLIIATSLLFELYLIESGFPLNCFEASDSASFVC